MANLPSKIGSPKGFWDTVRSVSVAEIVRESTRPLSIALVGPAEEREQVLQTLMAQDGVTENAAAPRALPEQPFVQGYDEVTLEAGFPRQQGIFDLVIDVGASRAGSVPGTPVYAVSELGGLPQVLDRIVADRPDLMLTLARTFPAFRRRTASLLISQTAGVNAQFALITGIAEQIPVLGAVGLPTTAISDIIVLTKNQLMMVLRLAAAYGLEVDYKSRFKEVAPVLGNAFGWRAVARELVGAVPVVGFLPRAMIAYAGTITVGRAVQFYYETGEQISTREMKRLYRDALKSARSRVKQLTASGGSGRRSRRALPASEGADGRAASQAEDVGVGHASRLP